MSYFKKLRHNTIIFIGFAITLLVLYLSWLPDPNIGLLPIFPSWLGKWTNENGNIRTSIPFILLGLIAEIIALENRNVKTKRTIALIVLILLVVIAELGQLLMPRRTFDFSDIAWGIVGSTIGMLLGIILKTLLGTPPKYNVMRILIYGINYSPELTGIGKYTGEMASWLVKQGHDVSVITAPPYYPEWKVHKVYSRKLWHKEIFDGVKVYRCPLYVPNNVTSLKRIIHEFSFLASILPIWILTLFQKKYDVVFCISPPFHLGLLPLLYAKIRGAKFINHIQDLQVDAAKDLGMIKNKRFLDIMFKIEKYIFDSGNFVSTISTGMQRKIRNKGIEEEKQFLFPNWVDETIIYPLSKEQSLKSEFGFQEHDRIILYSGNLGEKQGLEIIIEIAKLLVDKKNIHFVISGSGGGKEKLIKMVEESGLKNIAFYPLQPYEKLSALLAMADLHLVLQKKSASDLVMPSKLTGILAAGGCALVTAAPGTSLYHIVHKYDMGILVEPESISALRDAIEKALSINLDEIRNNARSYAEKYLSKNSILSDFERQLYEIIGTRTQKMIPESSDI